jgi:hypothetical protein
MTVTQAQILPPVNGRAHHRAIAAAFRSRIAQDAAGIRIAKAELRVLQRQGSDLAPGRQSVLARRRDAARARLIAYGLHRGLSLQRIETGRTSLDQLPTRLHGLIRDAAEQADREALS